jgi:MYXO-CTERM domain-containing protein
MAATVKGVKEVLPVTGGSSPLTALAALAVALLTRRRQIGST